MDKKKYDCLAEPYLSRFSNNSFSIFVQKYKVFFKSKRLLMKICITLKKARLYSKRSDRRFCCLSKVAVEVGTNGIL